MNDVDRELEALIRGEAEDVRPPEGAKARGWERLMAATTEGSGPDEDGGPGDAGGPGGGLPPPPAPTPVLKIVPLLKAAPIAALVVAGALLTWQKVGEPPVVADTLAPALDPAATALFGAPMHIPFAAEPAAPPPSAPPELPPDVSATPPPRLTAKPRVDPEEDNFAGELSLLAAGQAAIQRGELREGLALLRSHKQRFPRGHFAQERDALIAIARCDSNQSGARAAGQKFLQANGDSIHAERVRAACKLDE